MSKMEYIPKSDRDNNKKNNSILAKAAMVLTGMVVAMGAGLYGYESHEVSEPVAYEVSVEEEQGDDANEAAVEPAVANVRFRNFKLLNSHYNKHGVEMGFASAEEYEQAAAQVVANPESLHKIEAEDGDDVYYLESTNDFVVVSTDGYIRTYFRPDRGKAYYDKQ